MRLVIYKLPYGEKVLYNLGQLLEKLYKQKKIGIFCDQEIIEMVDRTLWVFSSNAFLPHDIANGTDKDGLQPILLSADIALINREIICVFNNTDLYKLMAEYVDNQKAMLVQDVIYMTQEELNIDEIKEKTKIDIVDIFKKKNNNWSKVSM